MKTVKVHKLTRTLGLDNTAKLEQSQDLALDLVPNVVPDLQLTEECVNFYRIL